MSGTISAFTIAILIGGQSVHPEGHRIGPFPDYVSCHTLQETIQNDISRGFSKDTVYGVVNDTWGIGGGAIHRLSDYKVVCINEVRDADSHEIISETFF